MSSSSAARTNLTSNDVRIGNYKLGQGTFRVCLEGTFRGGNRNDQEAACKRFKPQFRGMESEFFAQDFRNADKAIEFAEEWNEFCDFGKEILITKGAIHSSSSGIRYMVEPLIRYFTKYTSNNGWIGDTSDWEVRYLEAFSHYSYHSSGGTCIVCDLQGRYKYDRHSRRRCRFELTDIAICSVWRSYGPTDLGGKGIESFFANHKCNEFCKDHWSRPNYPTRWFPSTQSTAMFSSQFDQKLATSSRTTFRLGLNNVIEEDSDEDSYW
mmetsp:Transcript_32799/g.43747  ORF Transcript_32799/g.43747 Transcript_32799/m.43747 type:complete len:267 (+) Transcript_32799:93-893(+)